MSIMESIGKPADRPVIVTLCADSGMGKTSLAATFPKPIFIRAEDGLQAVPADIRPDAFPLVTSSDQLREQLIALLKEPHDYKTVVIDSVTALERIFLDEVLESDPKAKSINQALGGYGAGRAAVAAKHQNVRKTITLLAERRGMNAVFVAHADTEDVPDPELGKYARWTLRLHEKSMAPYVDDSDVVGFIRLVTRFRESEGEQRRAVSSGERELVCHAVASNVSKNRFGIDAVLPLPKGENPLVEFVPALKQKETTK